MRRPARTAGVEDRGKLLTLHRSFRQETRSRLSVHSLGLIMAALLSGQGGEPRPPITALRFSPDSAQLVVGTDRSIRVWSVEKQAFERDLNCAFPKVTGLAFHPDSAILTVSGGDPGASGGLSFYDWPAGMGLGEVTGHSDLCSAAAFNADGSLVASAGSDGLVIVYRWPGRSVAYKIEGHSGPVLAAAFSPDNELLVTASADRSIKVWSAQTGHLQRSFSHHTDIIHCLAFRPIVYFEGEALPFYCASGSQDKTVRVWQPAIGRMVRIVRGHDEAVLAVTYNADGTRIYSAGQEGIIRSIDADSDEILLSWKGHDEWIYSMAITPDGRKLATGDWSGLIKLWDIRALPARLFFEIR